MNSYMKLVRKGKCPTAGVVRTGSRRGLFSTKMLAPEIPAAQKTSSAASDLCLLLCMPDILKGNRVCILYREQGQEVSVNEKRELYFLFQSGTQSILIKATNPLAFFMDPFQ